jgi:hypothetical protein
MNRSRVVLAVLSAIAFVTVAVPFADAGGGMGTGAGTLACRLVMDGRNPVQVVSVDVQSLPAAQVVNTGPAVLVCESAGAVTVNPPPAAVEVDGANKLVCYPIQGANKAKDTATITDPFTASDPDDPSQAVTLGGLNLLCVMGIVTIP